MIPHSSIRIGLASGLLAALTLSLPAAAAHHEPGEAGKSVRGYGAEKAAKARKAKDEVLEETAAMRRQLEEKSREAKRGVEDEANEVADDLAERAEQLEGEAATEAQAIQGEASAKADEMRARRDERKAIQDEYKAQTPPSERAGKKPWWKFWGSEEAE